MHKGSTAQKFSQKLFKKISSQRKKIRKTKHLYLGDHALEKKYAKTFFKYTRNHGCNFQRNQRMFWLCSLVGKSFFLPIVRTNFLSPGNKV